MKDFKTAEMIKNRLGGNINLISGKKAVRYLLHKQEDIMNLLIKLNGLIRTPVRLEQIKLACKKHNIEYKQPVTLEYDSAWLSGFFDSDGHVYFNKNKKYANISICITQKHIEVLNELALIYKGKVYIHSYNLDTFNKETHNISKTIETRKIKSYRFVISKKEDVLNILKYYFSNNPSKSIKKNKLELILVYYDLINKKANKALKGSFLYKE